VQAASSDVSLNVRLFNQRAFADFSQVYLQVLTVPLASVVSETENGVAESGGPVAKAA
jgi:hypothetical protein